MKRRGTFVRPTVFLAVLALFSCVTINIYFPAEQVESVAGEIVDDVRGRSGSEPAAPGKDRSARDRGLRFVASWTPPALAADATTVSNPTIRALKEQMKARYAQLRPHFQSGLLQEGGDGYVKTGDLAGMGLRERQTLTRLVDAENRDRRTLYQEVAKALDIDASQTDRVAAIFAKEWQKSLP